jgi:ABC-type antimicrobial peptide transport system permease subunit
VIVGQGLAKKGGFTVGDTLEILDGDTLLNVQVEMICDSNEYMGNVVYFSENEFNYIPNYFSIITNDTVDNTLLYQQISGVLDKNGLLQPHIVSKTEIKENYWMKAIQGTQFIEILLFFIATVSIFLLLNQVLQFISQREHEYFMLRCMGITGRNLWTMAMIEGICILIVSIISGTLAGITVVPGFVDIATVTSGIGRVDNFIIDMTIATIVGFYAIVIYILGLLVATRKLYRQNVVNQLKGE